MAPPKFSKSTRDCLETGYKWKQLGSLAESFHEECRDWKLDDLHIELKPTINEYFYLCQA